MEYSFYSSPSYGVNRQKGVDSINLYWIEDDSEAVEECEELYSIIPIIDESDLSDLEEDQLADLDDEEEDIDF